jgi:predicted nucleic acid-binding protein
VTPIVDTGPLVALLDRSDRHHAWAVSVFSRLSGGLVTCESVIAETLFLCARNRVDPRAIHALLENQALRVLPCFVDAPAKLVQLLRRYASVPMSVADAGLVHLHETIARSFVITCDSDFHVYRRSRGRPIDALVPDALQ